MTHKDTLTKMVLINRVNLYKQLPGNK